MECVLTSKICVQAIWKSTRERPPEQVKFTLLGFLMNKEVGWPTTVAAKPKTSRQKQNTSRYLVSTWGFWFCCEVFGFAVRFSVLPWGQLVFAVRLLVLPWPLASPQTSLGVRLSRIHDKRTPKDVCGEATWQWATVKEDRTRQQSLPAKPRLPPLIRDWEIIKKIEIPLSLPSPRCKTNLIDFFSLIRRFGSSRPMVCLFRVILTWLLHLAGIKVSKV